MTKFKKGDIIIKRGYYLYNEWMDSEVTILAVDELNNTYYVDESFGSGPACMYPIKEVDKSYMLKEKTDAEKRYNHLRGLYEHEM